MRFQTLHRWPRSTRAAIDLQQRLAAQVVLRPLRAVVELLAGIDVAFSPDGGRAIAGVVVWNVRTASVVEEQVAAAPLRFPYVPGLLSFRELPAVIAALRRLRASPDAFLCDAQGLAHPRRCGLACHLGLWLDRPTVGCAKSRLCGAFEEPRPAKGSFSRLTLGDEQVGCVLRTRAGVKPLFVSPGHLCDHASGRRLTLLATTRFRLPEPTRLAHQLVTRARTEF